MPLVYTQQPDAYMPAFNSQFFAATSTNTAQPNFSYYISAYHASLVTPRVYRVPARPDDSMVWDAMSFAEQFVTTELNYLMAGWQKYGSVQEITINVGEIWDVAGVPTVAPGTDYTYYVWNGIVDYLPWVTYAFSNYIYDASVPYLNTFNAITQDITFSDRSSYLTVLNDFSGTAIDSIRIRTFNAAGTILGVYRIDNPYAGMATLDESYISIDIGHKGLSNIASGLVTVTSGVYPIITSSVASYEVTIVNGGAFNPIKTFTVKCESRYAVNTVHFLSKKGGFGTINFNRISEKRHDKNEQTYKVNPNTLVSGAYGYDYESAVERQLSVETATVITLRTDWLTDEQVTFYREILDSPICYLDLGSSRYARIYPQPKTYSDLPHYEKPLFQLTIDFRFTHTNTRQRGQ